MSDKDLQIKKIKEDEDYIRSSRYGNSLSSFLTKNPDPTDDSLISKLLMIPEAKVRKLYEEAIKMLKKRLEKEND